MAEITRETLELAALAAGHDVACTEAAFHGTDDPVNLYGGGLLLCGLQDPWRPNLDDGDAMKLAVRLNMMVDTTGAVVEAYGPERYTNKRVAHDGTEPDKLRAWREAVVLCAAAVGERMQKGGA